MSAVSVDVIQSTHCIVYRVLSTCYITSYTILCSVWTISSTKLRRLVVQTSTV